MSVESQWRIRKSDLAPAAKKGLMVKLDAAPRYVGVLRAAFPSPARWFGPYESYDPAFGSVLYVQDADPDALAVFLTFAETTLLMPTTLEECWVLGMHTVFDGAQPRRSDLGKLVRAAKTYGADPGQMIAAEELSRTMADRVAAHPRIRQADRILGIPANPPKASHNLPELMA